MKGSLEGKRALITGSARGIGRAIALKLAQAGAEVVINYVSHPSQAKEAAEQIQKADGKCVLAKADLSDPNGASQLMKQAGKLDILVLNASIQFRTKWDKITREEYDLQMNCNFWSSMRLIQEAVPAMKENHWGRIITIGSVQEAKPHPDMLVYSSSKAAQTMMMKSLALQLAGYGITVNNVAPGVIKTDRNREALSDETYARQVVESIPLGFCGEPEDCAGLVELLCAEEGRYITGQSIMIDGGKSL